MPCNSEYLEPTRKEVQLSQVACLLDELAGVRNPHRYWHGTHPDVYNRGANGDELVARLCAALQSVDVAKYSLEMQIWWRDHQRADRARVERELAQAADDSARAAALAKLTDHERRLLGY